MLKHNGLFCLSLEWSIFDHLIASFQGFSAKSSASLKGFVLGSNEVWVVSRRGFRVGLTMLAFLMGA